MKSNKIFLSNIFNSVSSAPDLVSDSTRYISSELNIQISNSSEWPDFEELIDDFGFSSVKISIDGSWSSLLEATKYYSLYAEKHLIY